MFDFFKDIRNELNGIDTTQIKIEKPKEEDKVFFFKKSTKRIIVVTAITYILLTIFTIYSLLKNNEINVEYFIKSAIMIPLSVGIIVTSIIKKKKSEIISMILIGIFLATLAFFIM